MINLNNFDWGWMEDTNVTNLKPLLTQELFVNRIYEKFFEVEEGDIVLDPFAGTGTTGAVAKKYGRNYILIEKEQGYCKVIEERLASIKGRQEWLEEHGKLN